MPEQSQNQPPDQSRPESAHQHAPHDHAPGSFKCPACSPTEHTAEDERAIQEDPATRSLSKALTTSFGLLKFMMLAMVVIFLVSNVTFVKQGKIGLIKRFGAYLRDENGRVIRYGPNQLVFVWPMPIETFEEVSMQTQTLTLNRPFWPKRKDMKAALNPDAKIVPVADSLDPARDRYNLTGDMNILHSRWRVRYRVVDPVKYRLAVAQVPKPAVEGAADANSAEGSSGLLAPADVLREIVIASIMRNMAGMAVDNILYRDAQSLFYRINTDVNRQLLDRSGEPFLGIRVDAVTNDGIFPPGKTQSAFDGVIGARSEQKKLESEAMAEAEKILKTAHSQANKILADASAYKTDVVSRAKGDARRLSDILAKFPGDPGGLHLYLQQYRYDMLKDILGKTTFYVLRRGQNWFILGGDNPQLFDDNQEKEKK